MKENKNVTHDSMGTPLTVPVRVGNIQREISGVAAQYGVTQWEKSFLTNIARCFKLSTAQDKTLCEIEAKVFGNDSDDED